MIPVRGVGASDEAGLKKKKKKKIPSPCPYFLASAVKWM